MEEIEKIVKYLEIPKKRERLLNNKRTLLKLKKELSDLSLHKKVAQYAYNLGIIECLIKEDTLESLNQIDLYLYGNEHLEQDEYVLLYKQFKKLISLLNTEDADYYQTIQTYLRYELSSINYPKIYIYQGKIDDNEEVFLDIISKSLYFTDGDYPNTVIMPYDDVESNRKLRHFYNNISFKYLEQLTKDYSFDLQTKNIGKVKILTKK